MSITVEHVVASIMRVLLTDYPVSYRKAYPSKKQAGLLKQRLIKQLRGISEVAVVNGFDRLIDDHGEFMPTVPMIVKYVKAEHNTITLQQQAEALIKKNSLLPPPRRSVNPFKDLRAALVNTGMTMDEKLQYHHNLIARSQSNQDVISGLNWHQCDFAGCSGAGCLSRSVSGGGKFYCRVHFRKMI